MIGKNEAEKITDKQRTEIGVIVESMVDDLVPRILSDPDDFSLMEDYSQEEDGKVILHWKWKSRELNRSQTFHRQAYAKTEEEFFNEIRSYMFSLCLTLANL